MGENTLASVLVSNNTMQYAPGFKKEEEEKKGGGNGGRKRRIE